MSTRLRLDEMLVARGLAPTRSQARDLIKRGCVRVDGLAASKAGREVGETSEIEVEAGAQPYVSRGGLKLAAALDTFGFDCAGVIAIDVGASTGGFTDVLLRRGAARVHAVDIGVGQLHPAIASDERVIAIERQDARLLDRSIVPEAAGAVVADLSFISITKALGPAMALTAPRAWLVGLIKPQFEVGRTHIGKGGIVREAAERERAVEAVRGWIEAQPGWRVVGVVASPIAGGSGNEEWLIGALRDE